jgi:hypothetical protein
MSVTFFLDVPNSALDLNVANDNASTVLSLMGLDGADPTGGRIEPAAAPVILRRLIKRQNCKSSLDQHVRESCQEGNVMECGRRREQVWRYLEKMMIICSASVKRNVAIVWG